MEKAAGEGNTDKVRKELDRIRDQMSADPSVGLEDSRKAEKESIELNYTQGIRESRLYQGWCLVYLSRLKEAIEILTDLSGQYGKDELSEDNIKVLNALGVAYNDLGDNTNAFYYYSRSLKLSREAGLIEREISVLNNMGGYYLDNKNYTKALNHYLELLEKARETDQSKELLSVVMSNTGNCYYYLGKYDEAESYFLESIELNKEIKSDVNESEILFSLAEIHFKKKDLEKTKDYVSKSLEIARRIDNKRLECEILLFLGETEDDISYYYQAHDLSKEIKTRYFYKESCQKLAEHFEKKGDFEKSLHYAKESFQTEKELNNMAAEKKFHNLEMEYEIERNRRNAEFFKSENLELKESLNWMTLLNKIARDTISSLDPKSIFNKVFRNINLLMDVTHFHVVYYNKENDNLEVVKAFVNGVEVPPFTFSADEYSSFAAWSIKNRQELLINDITNEFSNYVKKRASYGEGPDVNSSLTVPIFFRNDEIGALAILSYHKNAYSPEHVQLLKSLASFLSIAVDNSRNYEKVKELNKIILAEKEELEAANMRITELATHDNLTGLINRRVLYELLEAAMEQSRRRSETLAILFIDLDNFKPINDTWGHDRGDKVLIEIARRLKESVRSTDSVARIGGDEFLILLNPIKNRDEARRVAEKIIRTVSQPIKIIDTKVVMGMSIGISIYPEEDASAEQLIINADSAMYSVKKADKNGISFYGREV